MRTFHGVALSWDTTDDIIEVKLHRAPVNEIGTTTLRELEGLADHIRDGADGARALIFHSDRKGGFCAGADLRELHAGLERMDGLGIRELAGRFMAPVEDAAGPTLDIARDLARAALARGGKALVQPLVQREVRRFLERIHAVFDTLDTAPLLTIAATHGAVLGGGFELALCCDLIIADKSTRFGFPELRLGLVPGFGGIPRLERDVGNAVVRDVLLTGRTLNARRAHALGLVSQVTARGEALQAARHAAKQAARFDASTFRTAKAFAKKLPQARLQEEIDTFLQMLRSPAVKAGLDKFVNSTDVRPYLP